MSNGTQQSILTNEVEVKGTIKSSGSVRMDGKLEGDLVCQGDATLEVVDAAGKPVAGARIEVRQNQQLIYSSTVSPGSFVIDDLYPTGYGGDLEVLVIEADGGQHDPERDDARDAAIKIAGYSILRFWNHDILGNTDGVLEKITETLASCLPSPLRGEGQGEGSVQPTQTHEQSA